MNTTQPELPPNPEAGAQQQAATPAPADPTKMVAPPAEGEVGKLVAKLRRLALQNPLGTADPTITRAAALIEQQTAELALLLNDEADRAERGNG